MKPISLAGKIVIMIMVAELAGALGSVFTMPAIAGWYAGLIKPGFSPPNWLFAPAWLLLYALMGAATGLIWNSRSKLKQRALKIYWLQLVLNILWSFLFFGMRSPAYGLADIIALWLAIAAIIFAFYRIDKKAGWLLAPYILWVTFAAFLNYSVWAMN